MDNAVVLAQTYLRVKRIFHCRGVRSSMQYDKVATVATDLDLLASRFPGTGQPVPAASQSTRWDFGSRLGFIVHTSKPDYFSDVPSSPRSFCSRRRPNF